MTGPDRLASDIADSRAGLSDFVDGCSDEDWVSSPLGSSDPRPVCLIVDHVAHSYEYLGSWIEALVWGEGGAVDSDVVDALNSNHADSSTALSRAEVLAHLDESGDAIIRLVSGLGVDQLALDEGLVERFAQIAGRHADGHRSELEDALGVTPAH